MLIRGAQLDGIRDGTVDLAFRRWSAPRLRTGTRMRTAIGLVEVTSVDEVTVADLREEDARRAGLGSLDELLAFLARRPEDPAWRVGLRHAGSDPRVALREDAALSPDDVAAIAARLERYDRASPRGPWTATVLDLLDARPETRAAELAAGLGLDTQVLKREVRKLKELGLTESLAVGYRLSPRGRAFRAATAAGG